MENVFGLVVFTEELNHDIVIMTLHIHYDEDKKICSEERMIGRWSGESQTKKNDKIKSMWENQG